MRCLLIACACLGLTGCLDPGDPVLAARDTTRPRVESTDPEAGGEVTRNGSVSITFSELMDVRSLRPGIAVFPGQDEQNEFSLRIVIPPISETEQDIERGDIPFTVQVSLASGPFEPSTEYTLVLRTSLTDYEGNALAEQKRVLFRSGP